MAEQRRTLEQRRGGLARRLEEIGERSKEKVELECEAKALGARIDAYRELATAFGRDGIQAMVIENVLPELEDETNRLLSRMTTKQLEVQFLTTREAVSTKHDIETLDIIIRDEAGRRPYQLFSGGEAFRINFAIRVALSKLLARRAGATVDTLIIDEGFGTQDQEGRDGLVDALQSVARDFQLILVITHINELRDQFPNRIEIVKTDAGSRATLI
jgi:exonuclease SbcC